MGLSAPGIGSNLDVNGLVTQLMSIERQPLTLVQSREAAVQAQISAYGMLKSQISAFGDAATAMGSADLQANYKVTLADAEVASATASGAVVPGNYSLEVTQLAQTAKLATGTFAGATTVVGSGTLTISLGTYDSGANTFNARVDKPPITITLDSSNNTLAGVRDAINAAKAGVTATIISDRVGSRLVISGVETGADNSIKIASSALPAFAFDPTVATPQLVSSVQTAQDAKIKLDGIEVVNASNKVAGVIDGLTLNLTKAKPGQTTTISVTKDSSAAVTALRNLITGYNSLNAMARSYTKYDAASKTKGALQGEATAVAVVNQMRNTITGVLPAAPGEFTRLSDIGITLQVDGSLKLDETKLASTIAASGGFSSIGSMFIASSTNSDTFSSRIKAFVDKMQGTDGLIPSKTNGLTTTIRRLDAEQVTINARLVTVEARLRKQFNALDGNLASQNAVQAYLTSQTTIWNNNSSSTK
jgi:flagellar hook-associated protein 2